VEKIISKVYDSIKNGKAVVLVSVIGNSGSTPRGTGAKMAVFRDGSIVGTIGGGAVEYKSTQLALEALKEKKSYVQSFRLAPNDAADLGMICGGDMEVYFQHIEACDENIMLMENIKMQLEKNENSWIITEIEDNLWKVTIHDEFDINIRLDSIREKSKRYFMYVLKEAAKVYIFGGGHISQKLVPVLDSVQFRCIVVDDKSEFANPSLFPKAEKTIVDNFGSWSNIAINSSDYVVILTRGHLNDYDVLVQALKTEACYIGLVGSRTKLAKTRSKLIGDGYSEADFKRIYAPIGTAIKAETPEEIAISIAGQMINVRADLKNS
jgi:xanthine dehydrogenase accessory factor